ncbi:MAG: hypothetical protein HW412_633, partial [Bacteroidetes bacterium]|nr:hypothetical protein [Bacteroidota bacterium]
NTLDDLWEILQQVEEEKRDDDDVDEMKNKGRYTRDETEQRLEERGEDVLESRRKLLADERPRFIHINSERGEEVKHLA